MATILEIDHTKIFSLDDFFELAEQTIKPNDSESILAMAPMLKGLANDPTLVVEHLNQRVRDLFSGSSHGSSSLILPLGRGHDFYVRANIWPSMADLSSGRVLEDHLSYHIAHDHAFSFLTVTHHGSGYITDLYTYDQKLINGIVGEPISLEFVERVHFRKGMVMMYEAGSDVHVQLPPEDLSITLNLMVATPDLELRDQYSFNVDEGVVAGHLPDTGPSRRVGIVQMAKHIADGNTLQLLDDLSRSHACRRTRLSAFETLSSLLPASASEVWEGACRDRDSMVSNAGREALMR